MATVFVKHGDEIPYPNTSGSTIAVNTPVLVGDVVGVALTDIPNNTTGTLQLAGVADLPKKTGEAWTIGAKVYWDDSAKNFTTTATSNTCAAWAYQAQASGDTVGRLKLKVS